MVDCTCVKCQKKRLTACLDAIEKSDKSQDAKDFASSLARGLSTWHTMQENREINQGKTICRSEDLRWQ